MSRSPLRALAPALALLLAWPAAAQESEADKAYTALELKIVEVQRAPAPSKPKLYEELFKECGAFLDAHLQACTAEQVNRAGGLWLLLAERHRAPEEAVRARIAQLRGLPRVPPELARIMQRIEARLNLKPGAPAPAFSAPSLIEGGPRVSLEELRGKAVLLVFWASHNPASRELLQDRIVALQRRHAQDPRLVIVAVGVSLGNDTAEAQRAMAGEHRWPWRMVFDADGAIAQAYGVELVPYLALVDPEGRMGMVGPGPQVIDGVEQVLQQRLGPRPPQQGR
ncbi:MAG: TlpA family protein disulfide reductase [Planctomycetes bacterium]|nr:TlpA family protein disulfide reductase [Planctomycetota bacterium]